MLLFTSCKKNNEKESLVAPIVETEVTLPKKFRVVLNPEYNVNVTGKVMLKAEQNNVTLTAIVSGLVPGEHALYIQDKVNQSDDNSKFIGNLIADDSGNGTISKITEDWCIGCGNDAKDILGKHIVVYTKANDPSSTLETSISCSGLIK